MTYCLNTRALVPAMLIAHSCVSQCLWADILESKVMVFIFLKLITQSGKLKHQNPPPPPESRNIARNNFDAWSAAEIGMLCSTRKAVDNNSAFILLWEMFECSSFLVKDKSVGWFFFDSAYFLWRRPLTCIAQLFIPPCETVKLLSHTVQKAYVSPTDDGLSTGYAIIWCSRNRWPLRAFLLVESSLPLGVFGLEFSFSPWDRFEAIMTTTWVICLRNRK